MPVFKFFNGFPSFKKLFIYFWLCRVFVAAWTFLQLQRAGPTLQGGVQAPNFGGFSCHGARALGCAGFSRYGSWAQWWWFPGSTAVAHGLSCLAVCGIFPDQGLKPCPLHGQADSLPLSHQGHSPLILIKNKFFALYKVKRHLAPDHLSYLVFHIPPSTRPQALSVCLSLTHTHTHTPPTSTPTDTYIHTHTHPRPPTHTHTHTHTPPTPTHIRPPTHTYTHTHIPLAHCPEAALACFSDISFCLLCTCCSLESPS